MTIGRGTKPARCVSGFPDARGTARGGGAAVKDGVNAGSAASPDASPAGGDSSVPGEGSSDADGLASPGDSVEDGVVLGAGLPDGSGDCDGVALAGRDGAGDGVQRICRAPIGCGVKTGCNGVGGTIVLGNGDAETTAATVRCATTERPAPIASPTPITPTANATVLILTGPDGGGVRGRLRGVCVLIVTTSALPRQFGTNPVNFSVFR